MLCRGGAEPCCTPGTFPDPSWSQLSTGVELSPVFFFLTPRVIYLCAALVSPLPAPAAKKRFAKQRRLLAAGERQAEGCGLWLPRGGSFVFSSLGVCVPILFLYITEPPLISATGSENRNFFTDRKSPLDEILLKG